MPLRVKHIVEYTIEDEGSPTPAAIRSAVSRHSGRPLGRHNSILFVSGVPVFFDNATNSDPLPSNARNIEVVEPDMTSFELIVKDLNQCGPDIRLFVTWHYAISAVKMIIEEKCGLPTYAQRLAIDGNELQDEQRLGEVMSSTKTVVNLTDMSNDKFAIVGKTLAGRGFHMVAGVTDAVMQLKERFQWQEGTNPQEMGFICTGKADG